MYMLISKTGSSMTTYGILASVLLVILIGCTKPEKSSNRVEHLSGKTIGETILENRQHLLSIPGVLKVEPGICGADSCIKIFVEKKTAMLVSELPLMLETWQVDVVE